MLLLSSARNDSSFVFETWSITSASQNQLASSMILHVQREMPVGPQIVKPSPRSFHFPNLISSCATPNKSIKSVGGLPVHAEQERVSLTYEHVIMALLKTPEIARGFRKRRVAVRAFEDSWASTRQIWAAFHTAVRAQEDVTHSRRRALFFSINLSAQLWPWRNLRGAKSVRVERCQRMRVRGAKRWSAPLRRRRGSNSGGVDSHSPCWLAKGRVERARSGRDLLVMSR